MIKLTTEILLLPASDALSSPFPLLNSFDLIRKVIKGFQVSKSETVEPPEGQSSLVCMSMRSYSRRGFHTVGLFSEFYSGLSLIASCFRKTRNEQPSDPIYSTKMV